jgi:hypothetical protein
LYGCRRHKKGVLRTTFTMMEERFICCLILFSLFAPEFHAEHDGFPSDFSRF